MGLRGSALFCYTKKTPRIISGAYIFNSSAVLTVLIIIVIRVVRIILISLLGIGILILIRRLLITLLRISILIGSTVLLIGSPVLIVTLLIGRLILRIGRFCGIRIEAVTAQIETCVNELVKVVLHEDIINDSKAENADNKINNRIVVMLDTFFMQTVAQFLLRKIKSHKREDNDEQNLQQTVVIHILYVNRVLTELNAPVNTVNSASDNREQYAFYQISFFDYHK